MSSRFWWHIHHQQLIEQSDGNISQRRRFIKASKPAEEIPLRLYLLRPAKLPQDIRQQLLNNYWNISSGVAKKIYALHEEQCDPQCPFIPDEASINGPLWGNILTIYDDKKEQFILKNGYAVPTR